MARLLYQLVAPLDVTVGPAEPERRRAFLARHAAPSTEVEVRPAALARDAIESDWDAVEAGPAIVRGIRAAAESGADAAIVGCFSDPAIDAAREAVSIPVIGPGAASLHLALQLGDRIGVLAPGPGVAGRTRGMFRGLGLEASLASVRGVGLGVAEMAAADRDGRLDEAIGRVADVARASVEEDGAEVLLLGCMSMAFLDPTQAITARAGVPVVNPVLAALKSAEAHLALQLAHSRRRWPRTEARPLIPSRQTHDPDDQPTQEVTR